MHGVGGQTLYKSNDYVEWQEIENLNYKHTFFFTGFVEKWEDSSNRREYLVTNRLVFQDTRSMSAVSIWNLASLFRDSGPVQTKIKEITKECWKARWSV